MTFEPLKNDQQAQLNALYEQMEPEGLYPLWEKLAALVLPKPDSPAKVCPMLAPASRPALPRSTATGGWPERRAPMFAINAWVEGLGSGVAGVAGYGPVVAAQQFNTHR